MQFVILPLIFKGIEEKQNCIQRCFEMEKRLKVEKYRRLYSPDFWCLQIK